MRICLIGGVFGRPRSYQAMVKQAPETVLDAGLRARGHEVATYGHFDPVPFGAFDVVHVHHLASGAIAAASARAAPPLVFTSHWLRHNSRARRAAMGYVLRRATASVVLSEAEAAWQRRSYPVSERKQHLIPNGIDEHTFAYSPPVMPPNGEPWRLLYAGQLAPFKGISFLLRALPLVVQDLPVDLRLVYHVSADESALRQEAAQLGLRNVQFLGPKSSGELAAIYASSHVLILPSLAEALPTVISEALLVGRPVVATAVGGVRDQVGDFGEVVAPRDPRALAGAIERVLRGYGDFAAKSRAASALAMQRYSIAAMVDAHERLYTACVGASAVPRPIGARALDTVLRATLPRAARVRQRRAEGSN